MTAPTSKAPWIGETRKPTAQRLVMSGYNVQEPNLTNSAR
ncbi:hypothetical protein POR1_30 [Pseudomonas phage POR1]|uniref:Uncharacterized protein n=1 Tax=Pseudomonas phage POR1 TaxID=1718594 RepID=A0A0N9RT68_9CAUD|nr:hypothetical protein POR1_30 [Pseudomonas phage POR1]